MSITIPKISDIKERIISDVETRLGQSTPLFQNAYTRVFATALSSVFNSLYLYGGWQFKQIFVSTADEDALLRWGELVGVVRGAGTPYQGTIEITVTSQGGSLSAGTLLIDNTSQITYFLQSGVALDAPIVSADIEASVIGSFANLNVGTRLQFTQPLGVVDRQVSISATVLNGLDEESLELYRGRVQDAYAQRRQGGAVADYYLWSIAVQGVKNAFVYGGTTEGTIEIYIESTEDIDPDGVPPQALLDAVEANILDPNNNPVVGVPLVYPIGFATFQEGKRTLFGIEIENLSDNSVEVADALEEGLSSFLFSREPFIEGFSTSKKNIISQAEIDAQIVSILRPFGATHDGVTLTNDVVVGEIVSYELARGELAKLQTLVLVYF